MRVFSPCEPRGAANPTEGPRLGHTQPACWCYEIPRKCLCYFISGNSKQLAKEDEVQTSGGGEKLDRMRIIRRSWPKFSVQTRWNVILTAPHFTSVATRDGIALRPTHPTHLLPAPPSLKSTGKSSRAPGSQEKASAPRGHVRVNERRRPPS